MLKILPFLLLVLFNIAYCWNWVKKNHEFDEVKIMCFNKLMFTLYRYNWFSVHVDDISELSRLCLEGLLQTREVRGYVVGA